MIQRYVDELDVLAHGLAHSHGLNDGAAHGLGGHHDALAAMVRPEDQVRLNPQTEPFRVVLVFHEEHEQDQDRHHDNDDPGAFRELDENLNDYDHGRDAGSDAVYDGAAPPVGTALNPPVPNHSGLGEREGREHPDGVERNQRVHVSVEGPGQQDREPGQQH